MIPSQTPIDVIFPTNPAAFAHERD